MRSVSAFEIYRKVYRDVITPARVAELLMLNKSMPRSLMACLEGVVQNLTEIGNEFSQETEQFAQQLQAQLANHPIEKILQIGLHAYLVEFLENINELGKRLSHDFLVPL